MVYRSSLRNSSRPASPTARSRRPPTVGGLKPWVHRRCLNASPNSFVEGWAPSMMLLRVRSASGQCSARLRYRAAPRDVGAFEFRHALTRESVLEELLPLERIEIARAALAALELDQTDLGDSFGEHAAALAEEAGDTRRAADLLFQAARRARKRGALSSAVPMCDRAWSFVDEAEREWFEIGDVLLSVHRLPRPGSQRQHRRRADRSARPGLAPGRARNSRGEGHRGARRGPRRRDPALSRRVEQSHPTARDTGTHGCRDTNTATTERTSP